jgi:lipoyl(octanoyl) transferase
MTAEAAVDIENLRGLAGANAGAPVCLWQDIGVVDYQAAWALQLEHVANRKAGIGQDQLFFVEHPHVITFGRNGKDENLLVSRDRLAQLGVQYHETDRGGDVTYHGPGQLVCYPVMDLKNWNRDVGAYLRALEEVLIRTLADYGIAGHRDPGATGVWVDDAKVAAMGIHLSRWVTSHGFALNVTTDLDYFRHIVPCGLTRPVTSLTKLLGQAPDITELRARLIGHFGTVFGREMNPGGLQQTEQGS